MQLRALGLALASVLPACGPTGGGTGSDTGDTGGASTGDASTGDVSTGDASTGDASTGGSTAAPTTGETALRFVPDVWPLLMNCTCHVQATPSPGPPTSFFMGSDPAGAYDALINKPSSAPGLDIVEPDDSAKSYLYHKLAGTFVDVGGGGTIMPPGGVFPPADLDTVKAWIDGGALE